LLNFVAHQDDDFILMSPDLFNVVRAQRTTVASVVFTAGENLADSCSEYVTAREQGQMRAFEVMAGFDSPQPWDESVISAAGKDVRVLTLRDYTPALSIYYIGLPNRAQRDLEQLWNDRSNATTISTSPHQTNVATYTREELIATVLALLERFQPSDVNTMDSGKTWPLTYPFDHSDHVHSALFTLAALQRYQGAIGELRMYRAYNVMNEVRNVSDADYLRKLSLYQAYAPYDGFLCEGTIATVCHQLIVCNNPLNLVYDVFNLAQYPILVRKNLEGAIRGPGSTCLRALTDQAESGLALVPCTSEPLDSWALPDDGTLRHVRSQLCVSSGDGDPRGAPLTLKPCNASDRRQRFAMTGIGQLRGPDATCVDGKVPASLTLSECAREDGLLGYDVLFYPAAFDANDSDFGQQVPSSPAYAGSLSYGDLDHDGDDDVCVRTATGVSCALNEGGARFARATAYAIGFADGDGFDSASTGSTLQLANVAGGDGADLCARHHDGIFCAIWDDKQQTFGTVSKRSSGQDFSDASGYGDSAAYYGSVQLTDVNNDGKADVCGRNASGIECALNDGSGNFETVTQWTIEEFSDAALWFDAASGATVQFADINGDHFNDVCGRGSSGMICMLNTAGVGFVGFGEAHHWSDTGDFSNDEGWGDAAAHYGSVRLGDINGDGRADVCGRNANGLVCGLSMGEAFETARAVLASDPFTDTQGYASEAFGASLAIVRMDADSHLDLCLRGPLLAGGVGLRCALAP
jgi:LmbE family N-acetylglucosaminyl deacetylase